MCKEKKHKSIESPYHISTKSELPYIIVGGGLAAAGLILRYTDNTVPYTPLELAALDRSDVIPIDRGATRNWDEGAGTTSDILAITTLLLPTIFIANHHTRNDIGPIVVMGLEIAAINYGITNTIKSTVNRTRPYAYNTEAGLTYEERTDTKSRFSFISGHTSATASFSFFSAKVMTDYHPDMQTGWKIGIWTFAAALPAVTGYYRIEAGAHYPTDVIGGYIVGAATGLIIPHLHKKKSEESKWSFYPSRVFGKQGVGVAYKF